MHTFSCFERLGTYCGTLATAVVRVARTVQDGESTHIQLLSRLLSCSNPPAGELAHVNDPVPVEVQHALGT
jgi:hypothetical protein